MSPAGFEHYSINEISRILMNVLGSKNTPRYSNSPGKGKRR